MEFTGKVQTVNRDWLTGETSITFTVNESSALQQVDSIKDIEKLSIKAVKYRQKRSLDANAYYWVLATKIAQKAGTSTTEVHNEMLSDYGQLEYVNGSVMTLILLDEIEWKKLDSLHLKPTSRVKVLDNGKLYRVYYVMRGSSTYDTQEMSQLIDGIVSEAKSMGIETLPPYELERMKALWQKA